MEVRPGYKNTEVGVIPVDWDVRPLGRCGEVVMGQSPSGDSYNRRGEGTPLLNGPTEFTDRFPTKIQWTTQPTRFSELGDLLICVRGSSTGRTNYSDGRYAIGRGVAAIRARHTNDTMYLSYRVVAAVSSLLSQATGSTFPSVDGSTFNSIAIPLPSPAEQRSIAAALVDVDALLHSLDRLIIKKRDLKQAAMQQLLTGDTRLPRFTSEWKTRKLGGHVSFLKTGSNSRAELGIDGPVRNLHYGDIHASSSVFLCPLNLPTLNRDQCLRLGRLQHGDLVLADASEDRDGVGKSVEIQNPDAIETVAGLHTIVARFRPSILADGYKGYLQFYRPFSESLRRLAAGTKVYATMKSHVASIELSLPATDEQQAIAQVLKDMDAELDALERRRAKTHDLKIAMMQELLTGKTRLVPPATPCGDPHDPATAPGAADAEPRRQALH